MAARASALYVNKTAAQRGGVFCIGEHSPAVVVLLGRADLYSLHGFLGLDARLIDGAVATYRRVLGRGGLLVHDRAFYRLVDTSADDIRTRRALDQKPCLRGFAETSYQAKSWNTDRRCCARIEATTKGLDIRFVVTSIEIGRASCRERV